MVTAAKAIKDRMVVLAGIGVPMLAADLSRRLYAPNIKLVYEAGIIGAVPQRLPLSIGDPSLVSGAQSVCRMLDFFTFYLQRGLIDLALLQAVQIDRFGNLNTTVIGDYSYPKVRLPGSGGACEIASHAKRVLVMVWHNRRNLVEKVDFITSPGFLSGGQERSRLGLAGSGPYMVVTDLGVLKFHDVTKEMYLAAVHPGVKVEHVLERTGWPLKVADKLNTTSPPTEAELKLIREVLDPKKIYLKEQ